MSTNEEDKKKLSEIHRAVIKTSETVAVIASRIEQHEKNFTKIDESLKGVDKNFFDTDLEIKGLQAYKNKAMGAILILGILFGGLVTNIIQQIEGKKQKEATAVQPSSQPTQSQQIIIPPPIK